MRKFFLFTIILHIYLYLIVKQVLSISLEEAHNSEILRKCFEEIDQSQYNSSEVLLDKFKNYAYWSHEEIPCFARCIASEKGWFDIDLSRWNKQRIVDELGANMYNYCRFELNRAFKNVCSFAFKGLRCLKQAEMNVIITHNNLLECVKEKSISMDQLLEYYHFPQLEHIPCLFKCFADKSHLYTVDHDWNVLNWLKAFGPIRNENADISICRVNANEREKMDICAIMYEEYNCWERLNYNTDGISVTYKKALKKIFNF
ncbi:uncharacterized protein LOC119635132 [Glossina fuscipes]|uniref:Uncharacterized protein LOC119635132 n=2 Tax=Nemorhina TaxID=44051 RepID=A0A8U0WKJ4_9MUSC|nr:uncharacterized protein LOC119635132 [Glossina fuscipes]KAI9584258.1 hypothetical protein GQX74_006153 [Glossina fuscipes]